ncbi:MAG: SAM-dependent methyltransferase, partial [Pseudomonadota bacterium]
EAAEAAGIPCEIVPGITAAAGAAARMGQSLTERGTTDTLVLTTGRCQPGDSAPDWASHARPGTSFAFYMSVRSAPEIQATLLRAGWPSTSPVTIAADVTKADEKIVSCPLSHLPHSLKDHGVSGCAVLMLRWPKLAEAQSAPTPVARAVA